MLGQIATSPRPRQKRIFERKRQYRVVLDHQHPAD